MKHKLLLITFLVIIKANCQIVTPDKKTLKLDFSQFIFKNTLSSNHRIAIDYKTDNSVEIIKGHKITKLYTQGDTVFFKYPAFNKKSKYASIYNNKEFYILGNSIFNELTDTLVEYKKFKGYSIGAYTVPFRLRWDKDGGNFDYESSLSLTSNFILGYGRRSEARSRWDVSFGVGLTGANLDSLNSSVIENRTAMAFTANLGLVYKPSRNVNIGVFAGKDFLGNRDRKVDWKYNRQTWLGIGINISFNEVVTNTPDPVKDN